MRGDYIILDNGAYETGVPSSPTLIYDLAREIGVSCIVLPDYPFQELGKTIKAALEFLENEGSVSKYDYMFVPTADPGLEGLEGFLSSWTWASTGAVKAYIKWVGIAKNAGRYFLPHIPYNCARTYLLLEAKKRGLLGKQNLHALGYNAVWEPYYLSTFGVSSLDCSSPVWRGWCGYTMSDADWVDIPVDFFTTKPLNEARYSDIKANIGELVHYATNKEVDSCMI